MTVGSFPVNVGREFRANDLGDHMVSIHQSFTSLIRVTLKSLLDNNVTITDTEKVRKLLDFQTFCYTLIQHKFYVTLLFKK